MNDIQISSNVEKMRTASAERIGQLSDKFAENSIALGAEFAIVRETFPALSDDPYSNRPGWRAWIKENTVWGHDQTTRFIQIYENLGRYFAADGPRTRLNFEGLAYLARNTMPEAAIKKVMETTKGGNALSLTAIKKIVQPYLPSPAQAIKLAKETGKLVSARDGHVYSGASKDEIAAYSERRRLAYGVLDAIQLICNCGLTPKQFVDASENHWLTPIELRDVEAASNWLGKLVSPLEKRKGIINGKV